MRMRGGVVRLLRVMRVTRLVWRSADRERAVGNPRTGRTTVCFGSVRDLPDHVSLVGIGADRGHVLDAARAL
jgi:hypothetical protein